MTVIERTPGHNLYREWIDAPGTDAAEKEWHPQNPAVKERWEKLAARVAADRGAVEALRPFVEKYDAVGREFCPDFDGPLDLAAFEAAARVVRERAR